jgi:hypothetical protein
MADIITTNLDAGTDSPAAARVQLFEAVDRLNKMGHTTAGEGAALLGFPLTRIASAINTVEWALKAVPESAVSALIYVPPAQWAAIFAGTSTYDAAADINAAIAANTTVVLPPDAKFLCKSQIVIGRGKELFGYGRSSQLHIDFTTTANFPGLVGVAAARCRASRSMGSSTVP